MADCSISCWALVLGVVLVVGNIDAKKVEGATGVNPKGPRNCDDVLLRGDITEGYYAGYPNIDDPEEVGLIYCGVKDGMSTRDDSTPRSDPKNCRDLLDSGMTQSGINVIYPYANSPDIPVVVYCEQELVGGGWTVFQHRREMATQLDFYKSFDEYAVGFGNIGSEFWLGNDILNELTSQSVNELYVDLTDFKGVNKYARYSSFYVAPRDYEFSKPEWAYKLSVGIYSGTAGDALIGNSGLGFSAFDVDNCSWDGFDCAAGYDKGGWWYGPGVYNACGDTNPNGVYGDDQMSRAIRWYTFSDSYEKLQTVMLMTRPIVQQ